MDPFWSNSQTTGNINDNIADIISNDTIVPENTGMDVYDPAFEQDFNAITDTSLSTASGEDF
jgi:hypothetical protein